MILADGVCRGHCVIRQLVVLCNLADKVGCCLPIRKLLAEEGVEDCAGCVQCLQVILNIKS